MGLAFRKAGIYSVKSASRALMSRNEYLTLDEGTIMESSSTQKQIGLLSGNCMLCQRYGFSGGGFCEEFY
jgi:hypothetical protein